MVSLLDFWKVSFQLSHQIIKLCYPDLQAGIQSSMQNFQSNFNVGTWKIEPNTSTEDKAETGRICLQSAVSNSHERGPFEKFRT